MPKSNAIKEWPMSCQISEISNKKRRLPKKKFKVISKNNIPNNKKSLAKLLVGTRDLPWETLGHKKNWIDQVLLSEAQASRSE